MSHRSLTVITGHSVPRSQYGTIVGFPGPVVRAGPMVPGGPVVLLETLPRTDEIARPSQLKADVGRASRKLHPWRTEYRRAIRRPPLELPKMTHPG